MLITQGSSAEAAVGMAFVDEVTFQNIIFTSFFNTQHKLRLPVGDSPAVYRVCDCLLTFLKCSPHF